MEHTHKLQNIKSWAKDDRPREKFLLKGASALSEAELLAILISTGSRTMSAVDLAKVVFKTADNQLNKLAKLSVKDLMKVKGVGEAKAITIAAALELGKRRKEIEMPEKLPLLTSLRIYNHIKPHLYDLQHEEVWLVLFDRTMREIKTTRISIGGTAGTIVDPKIVFKQAIEHLAEQIVLIHNHPSGSLKPSPEDKALTLKLKNAAKLFDIQFVDHLIFTNNGYYSFNDMNEL